MWFLKFIQILYLYNLSICKWIFPQIVKKATVVPIFKKCDIYDVINYRPILILSCFSKVFERLVFDRMMKFLNNFQLLDAAQHGFRSGRSTQTGALDFVEFVYKCLGRGSYVLGLYFDLSRAFNSLFFEFILDKFYNMGFEG